MLRIGVVLDSFISSAWVVKVIEGIQSSDFARIELVVLHAGSRPGRRSALFDLYERWDYRRNKANCDATAQVDAAPLLRNIPSLAVDADVFSEDQLSAIRRRDLDVLLLFRPSGLWRSAADAVRYGVWSFHFGDNTRETDAPDLWGALVRRNPVSTSSLRIVTGAHDEGRTIYRSHASTDQLSIYSSRNPVYWKTAEFALRRLRDLDRHGMESIKSLPDEGDARDGNRGASSLQVILFMRRHVARWLQARIASMHRWPRTRWFIGIRRRSEDRSFDDTSGYRLLPCPEDRFYADPFLVEKDGKTFLFLEDFRYREGRAVLSYCELGADGTPGVPVEVLRRPYHLSYPYVFEHEGEMYMIPETKENRRVELYRATNFPAEWTFESVLLNDVHVVDATVQKIDGRFWMFAGVSDGRYSNSDELCLFYADSLKGPWTPHPANPVCSDVRRSRPAGLLFYDEGRLVRPSQDCGKAYGYALVFSEVVTLNEEKFEERVLRRIEPGMVKHCIGTHTYNRTKQFEVIDRTLPANTAKGDADRA